MPVYDYKCADHGLFYELAAMADSSNPMACPQCQRLCARVILMAPELLAMSASNRDAHARNEIACHQPQVSSSELRAEQQARGAHKKAKGCGCGDKPVRKSNLLYTACGNKMFPSMRPWMISH